MQEINIPDGYETPSIYEIYQDIKHVAIEDIGELLIAHILDNRMIVLQAKEDFKITRMNLPNAYKYYPELHKRWWYYRDMIDTKSGREKVKNSGLILLNGQKN